MVRLGLVALSLLLALPALADEATEIEVLKKQIQALQEQVRALEGHQVPVLSDGPISRFDGRWEGKIVGDKRAACRDGDVRVTIEEGKVEGTRWFFSGNLAPVKGKVGRNGAYSGYQNRIDVSGQFSEASGTMWYVDGSCENRIELKKVSGL